MSDAGRARQAPTPDTIQLAEFFRHASECDFTGTVEQITGRKVRAFVSGMDTWGLTGNTCCVFRQANSTERPKLSTR